jgi:hypothetical protein
MVCIVRAFGAQPKGITGCIRQQPAHNQALSYIKCMPEAPKFTRDPRYKDLLRKMKLPE